MRRTAFITLVSYIFSLVALCHLLRSIYSWPLTIGNWDVPLWVSYLAFLLAAFLVYSGFSILRRK